MRCLAFLVTILAACGSSPLSQMVDLAGPHELGVPQEMGSPPDLSTPDLTPPADLTPPEDLAARTTPCPLPPPGEWHVAPWGSDTQTLYKGTGSSDCPFKTINFAVTTADTDGHNATVYIHHDVRASQTIYGKNCSGGPPCDGAITISAVLGQILTVKGDGVPSDVVLTSDQPAVVEVPFEGTGTPGQVDLSNFTVVPTLLSTATTPGGIGIRMYGGQVVHDLVIKGVAPTATTPGTGKGIYAQASSGTMSIGPGITIDGASTGVDGTADLYGSSTAPTVIRNAQTCFFGRSIFNNTPGMKTVSLLNCGGAVASGQVDGVIVSNTASTTPITGLSNASTLSNAMISDLVGVGLANVATITGNVTVTRIMGNGVSVQNGSAGDYTGLTSTMNQGDGLRVEGTVKIRNSTFLQNAGSGVGVYKTGYLDAGNNGDLGGNVFNRTSMKNGLSGLCLLETSTQAVTASSSTFSCGYTGTGCTTTGTPSMTTSFTCMPGDLTIASGLTVTTPTPSCCN